MVHAGPPATPGHPAPRTLPTPDTTPADGGRHTPSPGTPDMAGTAAPQATEVDSPFARLTAVARYRLPDPDNPGGVDHAGQHDPDPAAGLALGTGRTPYDRAIRRWKQGQSRDNAKSKCRAAWRLLTGTDQARVTDDALRAHPWHQLTVEAAEDLHAAVTRRYPSQATRNDVICAVRAVVKECYHVRLIDARRRDELLEELYTLAPGRSNRRHRITEDEFSSLLDACLDTGSRFARARNAAIVALFRTTGLRVSELVRLDLADWNRREDALILSSTKNGDPHTLFLHPATKALLLRWLEVRGEEPGRLFHSARGPVHAAMSPESIRYMLRTRCDRAGIERFGTHDFRRTFATEMLRRYDAALVSKLLNHRKLASTLIYDMSTDDEMRHAVGSLNLPSHRIGGAA